MAVSCMALLADGSVRLASITPISPVGDMNDTAQNAGRSLSRVPDTKTLKALRLPQCLPFFAAELDSIFVRFASDGILSPPFSGWPQFALKTFERHL